jgi:hypothetical protein
MKNVASPRSRIAGKRRPAIPMIARSPAILWPCNTHFRSARECEKAAGEDLADGF